VLFFIPLKTEEMPTWISISSNVRLCRPVVVVDRAVFDVFGDGVDFASSARWPMPWWNPSTDFEG
jgi:hypothetical protein